MDVVSLNRTLDQELLALSRGASLECLVCGEFVLRTSRGVRCPECGAGLARADENAGTKLQFESQAG
jgi:Zn finger protein HypA/HybF involved in hydrogenase expression